MQRVQRAAHRRARTARRTRRRQALLFLDERAGKEFDADVARAFTSMMRRLEPQITEVTRDEKLFTPPQGLASIPSGAGDY